jgi:hypothetical protein
MNNHNTVSKGGNGLINVKSDIVITIKELKQ